MHYIQPGPLSEGLSAHDKPANVASLDIDSVIRFGATAAEHQRACEGRLERGGSTSTEAHGHQDGGLLSLPYNFVQLFQLYSQNDWCGQEDSNLHGVTR